MPNFCSFQKLLRIGQSWSLGLPWFFHNVPAFQLTLIVWTWSIGSDLSWFSMSCPWFSEQQLGEALWTSWTHCSWARCASEDSVLQVALVLHLSSIQRSIGSMTFGASWCPIPSKNDKIDQGSSTGPWDQPETWSTLRLGTCPATLTDGAKQKLRTPQLQDLDPGPGSTRWFKMV